MKILLSVLLALVIFGCAKPDYPILVGQCYRDADFNIYKIIKVGEFSSELAFMANDGSLNRIIRLPNYMLDVGNRMDCIQP